MQITSHYGEKIKPDSKEIGLEIGLILCKYFLNSEYLHYGYFIDGLCAKLQNLAQAQRNYAELLRNNIPAETKTILDVGCGSGKFALDLVNAGYKVDCISPSSNLTEHAKKLLGGKCHIFNNKFEDFVTDKKYDMIIFSESFQYINMDISISKAINFLNPGKHIMICDFFKTDPENKSQLGGGHPYEEYLTIINKYQLHPIIEKDITKETAPTIDIINNISMELAQPLYKLIFIVLDKHPLIAKLIRWKYKNTIKKIDQKYFKGLRNAEHFMSYKKYMLYLYKI